MIKHLVAWACAAALAGCASAPKPGLEPVGYEAVSIDKGRGKKEDWAALRRELDEHGPPAGPLDSKVSLPLNNMSLKEAARSLSMAAGVGITVLSAGTEDPPLPGRRVSLTAAGMPLRDALDWMMRETDAWYAWEGDGVSISCDPERLYATDLESLTYPLRTMRRFSKPLIGVEDFESEKDGIFRCVAACLREYHRCRPDSELTISPSRQEFVAICSAAAHRRIRQVLGEIARCDEPLQPLQAPAGEAELSGKLDRPVQASFNDMLVPEILERLSTQSGVSLGVDVRELAAREKTRLTLALGEVPLKAALDAVVRGAGLKGYALEPGRGIWLCRGEAYRYEGRLLWDGGQIRSYYAAPIVAKVGLERLMKLIRQNVTPEQWTGDLPAMAYSPTGRLVLFHTSRGHMQALSYLHKLQKTIESGKPIEE